MGLGFILNHHPNPSHPLTHPTCLYNPWSFTQPLYLSVLCYGTCLYRPMVSYPAAYLYVRTHGLLPSCPPPQLVCTDSWSLTQPPYPPHLGYMLRFGLEPMACDAFYVTFFKSPFSPATLEKRVFKTMRFQKSPL